ncbi:BRO family protein [Ectothiorhodospira shaposhnikovii]|uniref:BRO family protein n=1 Tax=Ectothiorhodospira shaposhnikovii TaxID=1054 RepID=UPI001EE9A06C|nr:BRO family protein [Ectothiorhodospira shaposhnikovii]MCG5512829.1 hypothetical protein [Ectothiorhodospira shaposhnikovii]
MNTEIITFAFQNHEIRFVLRDGQLWMVAKDLLNAMGTTIPVTRAEALIEKKLGKGMVDEQSIRVSSGIIAVKIITHSAAVMMLSRSSTANSVRVSQWLNDTVIPALSNLPEVEPTPETEPEIAGVPEPVAQTQPREVPFMFEGMDVRVTEVGGELWFVAKDIAEALGYTKFDSNLVKHVPEEWRGTNPIRTPSGTQDLTCLSEPGLYFFLARSNKPKSLPFQKWIAGEVLPAIRRTGEYRAQPENAFDIPKTLPEALRLAADQCERAERAEVMVRHQQKTISTMGQHLNYLTVDEYRALTHRYMTKSQKASLGSRAARICKEREIPIQVQRRQIQRDGMVREIQVNEYPRAVLEEIDGQSVFGG